MQKQANFILEQAIKGAHTRMSLASESGWARVPMSQTRVWNVTSWTLANCIFIQAWLPSQAP
jgi:hypothetical protein